MSMLTSLTMGASSTTSRMLDSPESDSNELAASAEMDSASESMR